MTKTLLQLVPALAMGPTLMILVGIKYVPSWMAPVGALMASLALIILFRAVWDQQRAFEEFRSQMMGKLAESGAAADLVRRDAS